MAFLVETGLGVANANSYITEEMLEEYAEDRGVTLPSGNVEAAMIRASSFIDSYRARFPGYRTFGRAQGLEWPRLGAFYPTQNSGVNPDGYSQFGYDHFYRSHTVDYILPNVIPIEIIKATCEATIRELNKPNTLMPDNVTESSGGGALKKITAGDTSKEYAVGVLATRSKTPFPLIDDILSVLLMTTGTFGVAIRG